MSASTAKKPQTTQKPVRPGISVAGKPREVSSDEMAAFSKMDEVMGKLLDINEATSDLASMMNEWHPAAIPYEPARMPPTALVHLLSAQYEAFAEYLNDRLLALRKGGAA